MLVHNISLFSTIIPIETNFACTQWTYNSFGDTTVYEIINDISFFLSNFTAYVMKLYNIINLPCVISSMIMT